MSGLLPAVLQASGGNSRKFDAVDGQKVNCLAQPNGVDSAACGDARDMKEQCKQGERLYAQQDWQGALDSFEKAANAAVSLGDKQGEARAVVAMADCLAKRQKVDDVLILGMYRHARDISMETGDDEVFFRSAVGIGSFLGSLKRWPMATKAWEAALSKAEANRDDEKRLYASTQLALLLLESSKGVTLVNEEKEKVDAGGDKHRACELLTAVVLELPPSATVAQLATAERNLATALRAAGSIADKQKAEQLMLKASRSLANLDEHKQLKASLETELVDFYGSNPSFVKGDPEKESLIREWHKKHASSSSSDTSTFDTARMSSDERYMHAKALSVQENLAHLSARDEESDSD